MSSGEYGDDHTAVRDTSPAICTEHLARWVSNALIDRNPHAKGGITSCSCGWVADSTDHKEGARQQREHRAEALRIEDAAAQSGVFPASWIGGGSDV